MKFKDNIKILQENNKFKEIKGAYIPYKEGIVDLTLMAHLSENAWEPDIVDISEKTTGCRLFSTEKLAKDLNANTIIQMTSDFIKGKGKKHFLAKIQEKKDKMLELGLDLIK